MMEKWLPASLRNSENPFYEELMKETEQITNEFIDSRIRTMKNIYSISDASLEDLMDIASTIFLLDKNVLLSVYGFLKDQSLDGTAHYQSDIRKITSLFFQLEFTRFDREVVMPGYTYREVGVYIEDPEYSDFTSYDNFTLFRQMVEAHAAGVKVSVEEGIIHFIYPIGTPEEMEANYVQSIRNAICDYAIQYEDGFTAMLAKDPVTEGWVSSISTFDNGCKMIVPGATEDLLDSLGETIKFHIEYSEYSVNAGEESLSVSWTDGNGIALVKFRNEIAKIPYSIAVRGTMNFYKSLFSTFGYNFPGVVSLMKTEENLQTGRLIDNIQLSQHGVEGSETSLVPVPIKEDFSAQVDITNTLDYNTGTEQNSQYDTLDSDSLFNKLDMIATSEETIYKKDLLLAFNLEKKHFSGDSVLPYQFTKFVQEIAALNQKATDVLDMCAIVSLDIDRDDLGSEIHVPSADPFMCVKPSSESYAEISLFDDFRMRAEVYERSGNTYKKFYDYRLNTATDVVWNPDFAANDQCLTTKFKVEGKKYRLSGLEATAESAKKITAPVPEAYRHYLTKNIVIKLFDIEHEETAYMLFKQDQLGQFVQITGPLSQQGTMYDIHVKIENNSFVFECADDFASLLDSYRLDFASEKPESKPARVVLKGEYTSGNETLSRELWTIDFEDEDSNGLYIDLPLNMDLMMLVSRHEEE